MNNPVSKAHKTVDPDIGPVKRLRYNPSTGTHEDVSPVRKFIKGPLPFDWISRANALPGKTGPVGVALWFLVGVQGSRKVKVTREVEQLAGCGRKAVSSALRALVNAGLVQWAVTKPGARPTVTVFEGVL